MTDPNLVDAVNNLANAVESIARCVWTVIIVVGCLFALAFLGRNEND
jgi:hypothetical protein